MNIFKCKPCVSKTKQVLQERDALLEDKGSLERENRDLKERVNCLELQIGEEDRQKTDEVQKLKAENEALCQECEGLLAAKQGEESKRRELDKQVVELQDAIKQARKAMDESEENFENREFDLEQRIEREKQRNQSELEMLRQACEKEKNLRHASEKKLLDLQEDIENERSQVDNQVREDELLCKIEELRQQVEAQREEKRKIEISTRNSIFQLQEEIFKERAESSKRIGEKEDSRRWESESTLSAAESDTTRAMQRLQQEKEQEGTQRDALQAQHIRNLHTEVEHLRRERDVLLEAKEEAEHQRQRLAKEVHCLQSTLSSHPRLAVPRPPAVQLPTCRRHAVESRRGFLREGQCPAVLGAEAAELASKQQRKRDAQAMHKQRCEVRKLKALLFGLEHTVQKERDDAEAKQAAGLWFSMFRNLHRSAECERIAAAGKTALYLQTLLDNVARESACLFASQHSERERMLDDNRRLEVESRASSQRFHELDLKNRKLRADLVGQEDLEKRRAALALLVQDGAIKPRYSRLKVAIKEPRYRRQSGAQEKAPILARSEGVVWIAERSQAAIAACTAPAQTAARCASVTEWDITGRMFQWKTSQGTMALRGQGKMRRRTRAQGEEGRR